MKKLLTILFTIFTLAGFSQGVTITVGGISAPTTVNNADSLGNKAAAEYLLKVDSNLYATVSFTKDTLGNYILTIDSLLLVNFDTLYKESLNETDFATSTKWTTFGNFSVSGGKAVFSGTSGTIRQKKADLLREGIASKDFQFTYTADSIDWVGCAAFINTDFATANDTLDLSDGTHTMTFTSNSNPVDFKIECTCTSGGFTLDDVSLRIRSDSIVFIKNDIYAGGIFAGTSIFSGDVQIEGTLRGGSPLKISPSIQLQYQNDSIIIKIDTADGGLSLNYRVHIHSRGNKPGSICLHPGTTIPLVNATGYRLWVDGATDELKWLLPNSDTSIKINYTLITADTSGNVIINGNIKSDTSKIDVLELNGTSADSMVTLATITGNIANDTTEADSIFVGVVVSGVTTYSIMNGQVTAGGCITLADDASITLPDAKTQSLIVYVDGDDEWALAAIQADGTVTLPATVGSVVNTDTDANLVINALGAGTLVSIRNRLGSTKTVCYTTIYKQ